MTAPPSVEAPPTRTLRLLAAGFDAASRDQFRRWVSDIPAEFEHLPDIPRAVRRLAGERWDALLVMTADASGDEIAWLADLLNGVEHRPALFVVTQRPSITMAVEAERHGVVDLLSLPLNRDVFSRALNKLSIASDEVPIPLPRIESHGIGENELVGESPAMLEVYKLVARVGPSRATVLLQGGSGTGKELVARALHASGTTATGPFVAVNCAAIPENLLESELFGHEKGAFTGAIARKIGRFELAAKGTLFLDEVADMSLALQAKVLRAVQEREIERVGGGGPIGVDVRLVAATNADLQEAVAAGRFREDLYYRLAVVTIPLPPLMERGNDLRLLTAYFVRMFAQRYQKTIDAISDRAWSCLERHNWVGNVRELRNVIERAVVVAHGHTLGSADLPETLVSGANGTGPQSERGLASLADVEAEHLARVLSHTEGHITSAAKILGIHRNTLTRKIREYGL